MYSTLNRSISLAITALLIGSSAMLAQPTLNFKSVDLQFPLVSIQFDVKCQGQYRSDLQHRNILLLENEKVISDYTLHCFGSDPSCMGAVLVIDRSASMGIGSPSRLDSAKEAARSFINLMKATCDQTGIVSFGEKANIDFWISQEKQPLLRTIDSLKAEGNSSGEDALIKAVLHFGQASWSESRGIIFMTDSTEEVTETTNEIIELAIRNRIRIYTVGFGLNYNSTLLQRYATKTGGRFYHASVSGSLINVMSEIRQDIVYPPQECWINYYTHCPDGIRREVRLTIQDLLECPGSAVSMKSFYTPRDTSVFQPVSIRLGERKAKGGTTVQIPLLLETFVGGEFNPSSFKILFDETCVQFKRIDVRGSLLDSVQVDWNPISGGIQFTTLRSKFLNGSGILAMLEFQLSDPELDTECPLALREWSFAAGCLRPILMPGKIIINARKPLVESAIASLDSVRFIPNGGYSPVSFPIEMLLYNFGDREAMNARATIHVDPTVLKLLSPADSVQSFGPRDVPRGSMSIARWEVAPLDRTSDAWTDVRIVASFDNHTPMDVEKRIWIQASTMLQCAINAPDSLNYNATFDGYDPNPFVVKCAVRNYSSAPMDSARATIILPSEMVLEPSNQPLTKVFTQKRLMPWTPGMPENEVEWRVRIPRTVLREEMLQIQVKVEAIDSVSAALVNSTCMADVYIPKIAPYYSCTGIWGIADSLRRNPSNTELIPNPFTISHTYVNLGNVPYRFEQVTLTVAGQMEGVNLISPNPVMLNRYIPVRDSAVVQFTFKVINAPQPRRVYLSFNLVDGDGELTRCTKSLYIPGVISIVSVDEQRDVQSFQLSQNYPNPFSESTTIDLKITD